MLADKRSAPCPVLHLLKSQNVQQWNLSFIPVANHNLQKSTDDHFQHGAHGQLTDLTGFGYDGVQHVLWLKCRNNMRGCLRPATDACLVGPAMRLSCMQTRHLVAKGSSIYWWPRCLPYGPATLMANSCALLLPPHATAASSPSNRSLCQPMACPWSMSKDKRRFCC